MMYKNRLMYIDNLRLLMIIFVVMVHISVTYSGIGDWYYIEPVQIGPIQTVVFGFFQSFTQGYFMGILFLIAGYFVPVSYDKKGFGKFIKDRLVRLGMPTLLYMFVINPFISIVLMNYRDFGNNGFLIFYIKYVVGFRFIENSGPLWFAFALLIFSIIYALLRKLFKLEAKKNEKKLPAISKILALVLLISVCAFLIRIVQPIGTSILNMQLCFFSQYVILFIVGIKSKRNEWLEKLDYAKGKAWLISGLVLGFISWVTFMLLGGALSGNLNVFMGGISWQSAAYCLWESFVSVSMSIGLLSLFKEKYNKQNKLINTMADNSFSVYVFHAPIVVAFSLLFAHVNLIPIVKFAILVSIIIPTCFLFTNFIICKIPFLRKLLV